MVGWLSWQTKMKIEARVYGRRRVQNKNNQQIISWTNENKRTYTEEQNKNKMDAPAPIPTTTKQYVEQFPLKKNDIGVICGKPTFTSCQQFIDTVKKNLIAMPDDRDLIYGKLHWLEDTSQLPHGPVVQVGKEVKQWNDS